MKSYLLRTCLGRYCRFLTGIRRLCTETSALEDDHDFYKFNKPHVPIMVEEVTEKLKLKEGDKFLDMTFGAGGHSAALLERYPHLQVFALDRDPLARKFAEELELKYPKQITFLEGRFSELSDLLKSCNEEENSFDGVLFDLGCSSMQFDYPERGFASNKDGPLDMRMDGDRIPGQLTAADVVAYANEEQLTNIFKVYGGEKQAIKIAKAIVAARSEFEPLKTTRQLVNLIETVLHKQVRHDKLHRRTNVATKVFLALRVFVNNEINELHQGLLLVHRYLKPGGRAVVLTFNSSEDKIVKRHFKNVSVDNCLGPLPLVFFNPEKTFTDEQLLDFKVIKWESSQKEIITPSSDEVSANPRARSAKLRSAVKVVQHEPNYLKLKNFLAKSYC